MKMKTTNLAVYAGQRVHFNLTISPAGHEAPVGALVIPGAEPMAMEVSGDQLVTPELAPGLYLYEIRCQGVTVLSGHVNVYPSPLSEHPGTVTLSGTADISGPVVQCEVTLGVGPQGEIGVPGPQGEPGEDGASAYQIWLDNGNSGTEEDFLAALVGPTGPQGEPGTPGGQGAIVYVTGATIPNPASVATGDEIVFTVTSDFDLAEAFVALSGQMSIGWTIRNTGSSDIVIYNGNDAIARIGASSFVRGSALIDATGSGISVFRQALGQEGYINLSADGKILTVRQPDGFMITPSCLSETQTGRNRAWAYNISPDITHIDGGGVLKPPANSGFFFTYLTNLKSIAGVDYSQVIKPDFMFAATGLESFDVCLPNATSGYGIFSGDSKLNTVRLIIPLTKNLRECFYSAPALRYVTLHAGMCTALDFQNVYADSAIGAMPLLESLEFESYNGTPALASCTTFKLYATHTNLTDQSISNCVEAFTDWSATGKSATCQFPAGRLTDDQKSTLTAKGWTYTEV